MNKAFLLALGAGAVLAGKSVFASNPPINYVGDMPNADQNLNAFLETIGDLESGGDYFALTGGGEFSDSSDHPAITGEFSGVPVGGGLRSFAAGKYQITRDTWIDLGGAETYGSFDKDAQDTAAADLISRRGGMNAVVSGDINSAINVLGKTWISLVNNSPERVKSLFVQHGGRLS